MGWWVSEIGWDIKSSSAPFAGTNTPALVACSATIILSGRQPPSPGRMLHPLATRNERGIVPDVYLSAGASVF